MKNTNKDDKKLKKFVIENKSKIIKGTIIVTGVCIGCVIYKEYDNFKLLKAIIYDGALDDAITHNDNKINYRYSKLSILANRTDEASVIKRRQYEDELKVLLKKADKYRKLENSILIK